MWDKQVVRKKLGPTVLYLRRERRLSQRDFAGLCLDKGEPITHSCLGKIESQQTTHPNDKTLHAIATGFGMGFHEFLRYVHDFVPEAK